jgi:hypothetical protein
MYHLIAIAISGLRAKMGGTHSCRIGFGSEAGQCTDQSNIQLDDLLYRGLRWAGEIGPIV